MRNCGWYYRECGTWQVLREVETEVFRLERTQAVSITVTIQ